MDSATVLQIIQKLLDERDQLLLERLDVRAKIEELNETDFAIERALADRRAAGRVFGQVIAVPADPDSFSSYDALEKEMMRLRSGKPWHPGKSKPTKEVLQYLSSSEGGDDQALPDAESGEVMPVQKANFRIRDRVLDFLEKAGAHGSKAAPIRAYLEQVHGQKTHEKTVGMTLYRLLKEGLVKRNGHVWFIASSEAKNPGAVTPGPDNSQD